MRASSSETQPTSLPDKEDYPSNRYAWYVVAVLTLAYVFSFIDRQILNLLAPMIQRDLGISDTQMSLLMGLSFALFYTIFGIPLGRLADVHSRRAIIAAGITFWSLMTAGCGLANKFWQLALMRMGVGVGEATLSPSAYSLIADYFRPERRATAISVYSMGIYIGAGIALVAGGLVLKFTSALESYQLPLLGPIRPWQMVFFLVGLPGLLVALLLVTVREPIRKGLRVSLATASRAVPLQEVFAYMRHNRLTFLCHNLGFAGLCLAAYGAASWGPTLLIRKHQWTGGDVGVTLGIINAVFGTLGVVSGGRMADRLRAGGRVDGTMRIGILAAVGSLPFCFLYPLMPTGLWVVIFMAPASFFMSMPFGVAPAAIQQLVPNNMRGQASAMYLFVINLIGLGCGPTAVALVTDYVFNDKNAIHFSLVIVCALAQVIAAVLIWLGLKPYRQTLDYLAEWNVSNR